MVWLEIKLFDLRLVVFRISIVVVMVEYLIFILMCLFGVLVRVKFFFVLLGVLMVFDLKLLYYDFGVY